MNALMVSLYLLWMPLSFPRDSNSEQRKFNAPDNFFGLFSRDRACTLMVTSSSREGQMFFIEMVIMVVFKIELG